MGRDGKNRRAPTYLYRSGFFSFSFLLFSPPRKKTSKKVERIRAGWKLPRVLKYLSILAA